MTAAGAMGTFAEMCDYLKLIQSLNILHQEGGGPSSRWTCPPIRAISISTGPRSPLLDKSWQTQTLGLARTMDGIEMAAISFGTTPEGMKEMPALLGIINTNSPLQLDVPMAEG